MALTRLRTRRAGLQVLALLTIGAITACAGLPKNYPRQESYTLADYSRTRIALATKPLTERHPRKSGIIPLDHGMDALAARLALADAAQQTLDVQYYIWHRDTTGVMVLDRLVAAADRGVRVRLLLDDAGNTPRDGNLLAIDAHPNIEVRIFNPATSRTLKFLNYFFEFERLNRRMHNKSYTADGSATIIGGRNIGDEYFDANEELAFADLDVLAVGPVVQEVLYSFDQFWNDRASIPIHVLARNNSQQVEPAAIRDLLATAANHNDDAAYRQQVSRSPLANVFRDGYAGDYLWGQARLFYDAPGKIDNTRTDARELMPQLELQMGAVKKELVIVSSYFIPKKSGVAFLRRLAQRGVRVRVITNSVTSTDVFFVHSSYARYRRELLKAGVELYEIKSDAKVWSKRDTARRRKKETALSAPSRASLHTKAFIFDRELTFIGSLNLDPRSIVHNTEIGMLVKNPDLARGAVRRLFDMLPENAYRLELVRVDPDSDEPGERLEWVTSENGVERRFTSEPHTNLLHRVVMWFTSLPPIENQM
jgi:putative cardiolipin synthase